MNIYNASYLKLIIKQKYYIPSHKNNSKLIRLLPLELISNIFDDLSNTIYEPVFPHLSIIYLMPTTTKLSPLLTHKRAANITLWSDITSIVYHK